MEGGSWRKETYDFLGLPLFVRGNSFVALGSNDARSEYDYADGVELGLYALEDGSEASVTVRSMSGESELVVRAVRAGNRIDFTVVEGSGKPFSVRLHGTGAVSSVEGSGASLQEGQIQVEAGQSAVSFSAVLAV